MDELLGPSVQLMFHVEHRHHERTTMTIDTCDSGNALSGDGKGLCQRPATEKVQITGTGPARGTYKMCRSCAGSWAVKSPRTVSFEPID